VSSAEALEERLRPPPAADTTAPPERLPEPPLTVIEARPGWGLVSPAELWRYRELLYSLIGRDIKVRYKQTVLGAAWAVLQPFATMVVFSLFIGRLVSAVPNGLPYPLFVFAGLLPWTFFANAISSASLSVVGNQNLVTKVYFPRIIIPLSSIGTGLVDFAVAFGLLLMMMAYYGVGPGLGVLVAPVVVLLLVAAALGLGVLLAALTVTYRDFRTVVPFALQWGMFATPCIYLDAGSVVGPRWQALLPLNPAYGLILNFRLALLGGPIDWPALGVSAAVSVVLLLLGCLYFRRVEQRFADII
jgi:lipopolysaccharide transport system permease protein